MEHTIMGFFCRSDVIDWKVPAKQLKPSELLWTLIRCEYYRKNLDSCGDGLSNIEDLIPDLINICELIRELTDLIAVEGEESNLLRALSLRYLLRLTAFSG
jgi:hypothetical protein